MDRELRSVSDRRTLLDQTPPTFSRTDTREARVLLIGELAQGLLDMRMPSREAATFLGAALLAWLDEGGSLTRDYLKLDAPQGVRDTAQVIWRSRS